MSPGEPVGPFSPFDPNGPLSPVGPGCPSGPLCPFSPVSPIGPAIPLSPLSPWSPVDPLSPVIPLSPGVPLSPVVPLSPRVPCGPAWPLSPGVPWIPTGLTLKDDFVECFDFGISEIVSVLVSDCNFCFGFIEETSNTECNEENRSVTTIQILSRSFIDEGSGFSGEPIVSENVPSFTWRWKLPFHKDGNCLVLIDSSEGLLSVIAIWAS